MESLLFNVESVNQYYLDEAQKKLDNKTKPPGSLGRLEECARNIAAIKKTLSPKLEKKYVYVFAGDHGVMEEDVSHPWTQEVTRQMVFNFLGGGAGINVLARFVGSSVVVVDMGVNFEFGDALQGLVDRKIGYGTKNIRNEPAMALH